MQGPTAGLQQLPPRQRAVLALRSNSNQERDTVGGFLRERKIGPGASLLVPTRANNQRAYGVHFPTPQTDIARR